MGRKTQKSPYQLLIRPNTNVTQHYSKHAAIQNKIKESAAITITPNLRLPCLSAAASTEQPRKSMQCPISPGLLMADNIASEFE
jgi:hypothetical protein